MVTIVNIHKREGKNGPFIVLELEGGLQIQQSQKSGKMYASISKCTLPCAADELTARQLIGTTLPGSIVKVPCEPYDYINPKNGEVVTLNYQYSYQASKSNSEKQEDSGRKIGELIVL